MAEHEHHSLFRYLDDTTRTALGSNWTSGTAFNSIMVAGSGAAAVRSNISNWGTQPTARESRSTNVGAHCVYEQLREQPCVELRQLVLASDLSMDCAVGACTPCLPTSPSHDAAGVPHAAYNGCPHACPGRRLSPREPDC